MHHCCQAVFSMHSVRVLPFVEAVWLPGQGRPRRHAQQGSEYTSGVSRLYCRPSWPLWSRLNERRTTDILLSFYRPRGERRRRKVRTRNEAIP